MNDNHYISMFEPIISNCKNKHDYQSAYTRISSCIAGIILGRGFNQSLEDYLSSNPVKHAFYNWWMAIKDTLHTKAFN